jgi:hypothetical protein
MTDPRPQFARGKKKTVKRMVNGQAYDFHSKQMTVVKQTTSGLTRAPAQCAAPDQLPHCPAAALPGSSIARLPH